MYMWCLALTRGLCMDPLCASYLICVLYVWGTSLLSVVLGTCSQRNIHTIVHLYNYKYYISHYICTVIALCYLVLVSSFVFCIDSAFTFLPNSTFSCINAIKPRWQADRVKLLLKTCSNCCRDINGKLEPIASSYFKLCILYLQFTFTY